MLSAFVFEVFLKLSLEVARNEFKCRLRLFLKLFLNFIQSARNELKCRLRLFLKFFLRLLIEVAKNELKCSPHLFVSVLGPVGIEPTTLGL